MKIAFVLNKISGGGIARVVSTYANLIAENTGHDIYLVLMHKKEHLYKLHPKVKIIENNHKRKLFNKLFYSVRSFLFLRSVAKHHKFDRLIVNGEWINSFAYFATLNTGIKEIFLFDHSNPLRKSQSPFSPADKIAYNKASGILVLSNAAKDKIQNKFTSAKYVEIIDNPVVFLNSQADQNKENILISMGRLSEEKGQDILIKAFVKAKLKDWKLHLLGDGLIKDELQKLTKQLEIEDDVVFLGNQQDIAKYLQRAKIYVMPSKTENFPMALLEAMSIGLPCIVTNCMPWRGEEDFITHKVNGLKVAVDDVDEMAEAMNYLVENEEERMRLGKESLKIKERLNLDQTFINFRKVLKI